LYSKGSVGLEEIKEGFERTDIGAATSLCNSPSMHYDFGKDLQLEELCKPHMDRCLD